MDATLETSLKQLVSAQKLGDREHDKKINKSNLDFLQKEIRRTLDHAVKAFSVKRSVGKPEPIEKHDGISEDDEDEDSLDFMATATKTLGPQIPMERRLILSQIIQKMAAVWREKKNSKINLIMRWRAIRLSEKLKQLKSQNKAYMKIHKIFEKRYFSFFKIIEAGRVKQKMATMGGFLMPGMNPALFESQIIAPVTKTAGKITNIMESTVIAQNTFSKPQGLAVTNLTGTRTTGDASKLQNEIENLKSQVKAKDEKIDELEEEIERLQMMTQNDDLFGESPVIQTTKKTTVTTTTNGDRSIRTTHEGSMSARSNRGDETEGLRLKIRSLEADIKNRINEVKSMETDFKKRLDDARLESSKEIKSLREIEEKLRRELTELRSKGDSSSRTTSDAQARFTKDLADLRSSFDLERKTFVDEKTKLLESKNNEIKHMKAQYEDNIEKIKQQANDRIKQLRDAFDKQMGENTAMTKKLSSGTAGQNVQSLVEAQIKLRLDSEKNKYEKAYDELENSYFQMKSKLDLSDQENMHLRELLEHHNTSRTHTLVESITERTKTIMIGGTNKITPKLPASYYGTVLTGIKKGRFMYHALRDFQRLMKQKGFNAILKHTIIARKASGEAGHRIKGRLLSLLREKYKDVGVRRAFLRWAIFVNKNFLRDCIMKVALNARITHQSAVWRFRKNVKQNVRVKLPEATRKLRYMAGIHIIDLLTQLRQFHMQVEAVNKMRPGVVGRIHRLLIDILARKHAQEQYVKSKALRKLVDFKNRVRDILETLFDSNKHKLRDALRKLIENSRMRGLTAGLLDADVDIRESISILNRHSKINVTKFLTLSKARDRESAMRHIINVYDRSRNDLLHNALQQLISNSYERKLKATLRAKIIRHITTTFVSKQYIREKDALDKLKAWNDLVNRTNAEIYSKKDRETLRRERLLKRIGEKLRNASFGKIDDAFGRGLNNLRDLTGRDRLDRLQRETKEQIRRRILKKLFGDLAGRRKFDQAEAMRRLRDLLNESNVNNRLGDLEKRLRDAMGDAEKTRRNKLMRSIFMNMARNLLAAEREAYARLGDNYRDSVYRETITKTTTETTITIRRHVMNNTFNKLGANTRGWKTDALNKLRLNKDNTKKDEELKKLQEETQKYSFDRIFKKMLERLKLAQNGKEKQSVFNMVKYNEYMDHLEEMARIEKETAAKLRRRTINTNLDRLRNAQENKQRDGIQRMRDRLKDQSAKDIVNRAEVERQKALQKKILQQLMERTGGSARNQLGSTFSKLLRNRYTEQNTYELREVTTRATIILRQKRQNTYIDRLGGSQKGKLIEALTKLRDNMRYLKLVDTVQNTKEEAAKRMSKYLVGKILDRMNTAQNSKALQLIQGLADNARAIAHEEEIRRMRDEIDQRIRDKITQKIKERFRAGATSLLRQGYNKLKDLALAKRTIEALEYEKLKGSQLGRNKMIQKLFDRLKFAQMIKKFEGLSSLKALKKSVDNEEALRSVRDDAAKKILQKTINHLVERMSGNQFTKLEDTMRHLRDFNRMMKGIDAENDSKYRLMDEGKKRIFRNLLDKIKLANAVKRLSAFNNLWDNKKSLENADAFGGLKKDTTKKLMQKTLAHLLERIAGNQNIKLEDALRYLRLFNMRCKASEAEAQSRFKFLDEAKNKTLKNMLDKLKLASGIKRLAAFNQMKELKRSLQGADAIRDLQSEAAKKLLQKTLTHLFEKIGGSQQIKLEDALRHLRDFNHKMKTKQAEADSLFKQIDETKKRLLRSLLDKLKLNSTILKLGSLNKLRDNKKEIEKREAESLAKFKAMSEGKKRVLRNLLDKLKVNSTMLKLASLNKLRDNKRALEKIEAEQMARFKSLDEGKKRLLGKLLEKLQLSSTILKLGSLNKLKDNRRNLERIEAENIAKFKAMDENKKRLVHNLLDRLKQNTNLLKLSTINKLKDNNRALEKIEAEKIARFKALDQGKKRLLRSLLDKLKLSSNLMKLASINKLKENKRALEKIEAENMARFKAMDEGKKRLLSKLLEKLRLNTTLLKLNSINKLKDNNRALEKIEAENLARFRAMDESKKRLLGSILDKLKLNGTILKLGSFNKLRDNKRALEKIEAENMARFKAMDEGKKRLLRNLLDKLKLNSTILKLGSFNKLRDNQRELEKIEAENMARFKAMDAGKKRLLRKLLDKLQLNTTIKKLGSLNRLRDNKRILEKIEADNLARFKAMDEGKKRLLRSLLDKLKLNNTILKLGILNKLRDNKRALDKIEADNIARFKALDEGKKRLLRSLLDKLKLSSNLMKLASINKLKENKRALEKIEAENMARFKAMDEGKKRLLSKLLEKLRLNSTILKLGSLNKLRDNKNALERIEAENMARFKAMDEGKKRLLRSLLDKLRLNSNLRKLSCFKKLQDNKRMLDSLETINGIKNDASQRMKHKILHRMLAKLGESHFDCLDDALAKLRDFNRFMKNLENETSNRLDRLNQTKRTAISNVMTRLMGGANLKKRIAFDRLRMNANELINRENGEKLKNLMNSSDRKRLMRAVINRLRNTTIGRIHDGFYRLVNHKRIGDVLGAAEMTKEQAEEKMKQIKQIEFLHRLKQAQDAKATEALRELFNIMNKATHDRETKGLLSEAARKLREKRLKDLMTRLRMAQVNKERQAVRNFKNHKKQMEEEEEKYNEAHRMSDEMKERIMKALTHNLINSRTGRLTDALHTLREFRKIRILMEKLENVKKANLLNSLMKAYFTKTLDASDRIKQNYLEEKNRERISQLNEKLKSDKMRLMISKMLDKLRDAQKAKANHAINDLKTLADMLNNMETIESLRAKHIKKLRAKMLLGLLNGSNNKLLWAYQRLVDNKNQLAADERDRLLREQLLKQKRDDLIRNLLNRLISGQNGKKHDAIQAMIANELDSRHLEETELKNRLLRGERKNNLLKSLLGRCLNRRDEAWYKLRQMGLQSGDAINALRKNKLIGDLINGQENSLSQAFYKLITFYRERMYEDMVDRNRKVKLMRRVIFACKSKEAQALYILRTHKNELSRNESEYKLKLKHHAEMLREIGAINGIRNREICYLKLKAYAEDKKRKEQLMRNVILALFKSHDAKKKDAANLLRQHNLYSHAQQRLNDTLLDVETDKKLNLRRRMLKKFLRSCDLKKLCAIRELRYHADKEKEREARGKLYVENLLKLANGSLDLNKIYAYKKCVLYARSTKDIDSKQKKILRFIVNKISNSNEFKEADALHRLRDNYRDADKALNALRLSKVSLINRLGSSLSVKKLQAFNNLRNHASGIGRDDLGKRAKLDKIFNILMGTQKGKNLLAFGRLKDNWRDSVIDKLKRNGLLNRLANRLTNSNILKLLEAYRRLKDHNDHAQRLKDSLRTKLGLLSTKLGSGQGSKLLEAFNRLRKNKVDLENAEKDRLRRKGDLLLRLIGAVGNKELEALFRLRHFSNSKYITDEEKRVKRNLLVGKLGSSQVAKLLEALNNLRRHAHDASSNLDRRRKVLQYILNKMGAAASSKGLGGLDLLRNHARRLQLSDEAKRNLRTKIISRLLSGYRSKLENGFNHLRQHKQDTDEKTRRIKSQLLYLLNKLNGSAAAKAYEAFAALRRNNDDLKSKSDRIKDRLSYIFNKTAAGYHGKLYDSLDILRECNIHYSRIQDEFKTRMVYLLNKLASAHQAKVHHSILILEELKTPLGKQYGPEDAIRAILLRLDRSNESVTMQALNKLRNNAKDRALAEQADRLRKLKIFDKLVNMLKSKSQNAFDNLFDNSKEAGIRSRLLQSKISYLLSKIGGANDSKSRDALGLLGRNNSAGRDKSERMAKILRYILAKIGGATDAKKVDSFRILLQNASSIGDGDNLPKALRNIVNRLSNSNTARTLEAFNKLRNRNTRVKTLVDRLVGGLGHSTTNLLRQAYERLHQNAFSSKIDDLKRKMLERLLADRLGSAANIKLSEAFHRLISNWRGANSLSALRAAALSRLMNSVRGGFRGQTEHALGGLKRNRDDDKNRDERLKRARALLVRALFEGSVKTARDAYNRLKDNSNRMLIDKYSRDNLKNKLIRNFIKSSLLKTESAMSKLKDLANLGFLQKIREKYLITNMLNRLAKGQNGPLGQAFYRLKDNANDGRSKQAREDALRRKLIENLLNSYNLRQRDASGLLKDHNARLGQKRLREEYLKKYIIKSLFHGASGQLGDAWDRLLENKRSADEVLRRRNLLNNRLSRYLIDGENGKLNEAFKKLLENRLLSDNNKLRRQNAAIKLTNRLERAYKLKTYDAASQLHKNKDYLSAMEERARRARHASTKFLSDLYAHKRAEELARAYEKMVNNALASRLITERRKKMLSDFVHVKEMQIQKVVYTLRINSVLEKQRSSARNQKLAKLFDSMYSRLTRDSYSRMLRNTLNKQRLINLLNRAEQQMTRKLVQTYYEKMKLLIKNRPERIIKFVDLLNGMVRMREQQGYSMINLYTSMKKQEIITKGLVKLSDLFNKFSKSRKSSCFYEIKSKYHNENPWFKKSLEKFTVAPTASVQISFWRIKTQQNFGNALLSVEKAVKFKQMVEIIERRRQKVLQFAFTRVDVSRNLSLNDSMLNINLTASAFPLGVRGGQLSSRESNFKTQHLNKSFL